MYPTQWTGTRTASSLFHPFHWRWNSLCTLCPSSSPTPLSGLSNSQLSLSTLPSVSFPLDFDKICDTPSSFSMRVRPIFIAIIVVEVIYPALWLLVGLNRHTLTLRPMTLCKYLLVMPCYKFLAGSKHDRKTMLIIWMFSTEYPTGCPAGCPTRWSTGVLLALLLDTPLYTLPDVLLDVLFGICVPDMTSSKVSTKTKRRWPSAHRHLLPGQWVCQISYAAVNDPNFLFSLVISELPRAIRNPFKKPW